MRIRQVQVNISFEPRSHMSFQTLPRNRVDKCLTQLRHLLLMQKLPLSTDKGTLIRLPMVGLGQMSRLNARCLPIDVICNIHCLLNSLVVECWLRLREVPSSIPSQGPRRTKDIIKMVPVKPLFSTEHSKGKILALSQELR